MLENKIPVIVIMPNRSIIKLTLHDTRMGVDYMLHKHFYNPIFLTMHPYSVQRQADTPAAAVGW